MAGMAVTFGVVLHVDRAPAAPAAMAPSVHVPVIEGKVIAESINPVLPIESGQQAQFNMPKQRPSSVAQFPTYDARGERQVRGVGSGVLLDVFA